MLGHSRVDEQNSSELYVPVRRFIQAMDRRRDGIVPDPAVLGGGDACLVAHAGGDLRVRRPRWGIAGNVSGLRRIDSPWNEEWNHEIHETHERVA